MPSKHIVILGGGILGASSAYYLTQAGLKVTIIENVGIASAASGRSGGFLAKDWHGHETADLGVLSFGLHRELAERLGGVDKWGYRKVKTYSTRHVAGGKDRQLGRKYGVDWLDGAVAQLEKVEVLGDEETTAQVDPRALTNELIAQGRAKGLEVVLGRVESIKIDGPTKTLSLGDGQTIECSDVVVAAGPWSGRLMTGLFSDLLSKSDLKKIAPIDGQKAHSIILKTPKPASAHILFTSIRTPSGKTEGPEVYARPNGTVYICGGDDDAPLPEDARNIDPDRKKTGRLIELAGLISPELLGHANTSVEVEQACYLPTSAKGHPLIGPWGKTKGLNGFWINTGHSCWGVSLSLGSGKVLAEMMQGQKTSADVRDLLPRL